jgi:hypothetical protein
MSHHEPRRLAHHFPPFNEAQAREFDKANRDEWQESMRSQRRCVLLVILFWAVVAWLIFILHS